MPFNYPTGTHLVYQVFSYLPSPDFLLFSTKNKIRNLILIHNNTVSQALVVKG